MKMANQKDLQGIAREENLRICPDCKSNNVENQKGELICKKCGLVIE